MTMKWAERDELTGSSTAWPIDWAWLLPAPARRSTPHIRFEQPWPQWLLVFTVLGAWP